MAERGRLASLLSAAVSASNGAPGATTPGLMAEEVAAFSAWLDNDALLARLEQETELAADLLTRLQRLSPLGERERVDKQRDIEDRLLDLERIEEALVDASADATRRPEANPLAVLGLRPVEARSVAA